MSFLAIDRNLQHGRQRRCPYLTFDELISSPETCLIANHDASEEYFPNETACGQLCTRTKQYRFP